MNGLRLAVVVPNARPGGGQDRYALELVNRLAGRHRVTLIAAGSEQLSGAVDFRQVRLPQRPAAVRRPLFARRARAVLARGRWDVVHTIGGALPGATVITAQFCQRAWGVAQDRWPSRLTPFARRLYHRALARSAASYEQRAARAPALKGLIAVSRATLREWEDGYHPTAPVRAVIPNGVDLQRFRPGTVEDRAALRARLELGPDATVLLLVGALVRKGIETAVEVVARLSQPTVALVAVGDGPLERVVAHSRTLGVRDRVRLVRHAADVECFYRGADIFLFPSRYEPFGMAVAEAWSSGLPVVAAGRVGALEWATRGEHVLTVENPVDAAGFASAVQRLVDDRALRAALGNAGRQLAAQFSWERVVGDTENVYAGILGSGPGKQDS